MVDTQKVVVLLLVLAILFSIISVTLTLTLHGFEPVTSRSNSQTGAGANSGGNLQLSVEPSTGASG